jgi:hypothetical protein
LNAFAERFVRSIKEECLDQLILFGEPAPRAIDQFVDQEHPIKGRTMSFSAGPTLLPVGLAPERSFVTAGSADC